MPAKNKFTISTEDSGQRLDHFISAKFPENTRSYFTKNIKNGNITVNNKPVKPGYDLMENDSVVLKIVEPDTTLKATNIKLDLIFEDDDLLVINKPAGLTVHPGNGTENDTLVNGLLFYTNSLALKGKSNRPGIVHRLDKNTSGLLVVAKNDKTHAGLRRQFDTKTIKRTYWSLVWGTTKENSGIIHTHIDRSKKVPTKMAVTKTGREAITHWKVLRDYKYFTLMQLNLETGRTHQIRLHMNWLGNPVVGDKDYNGRNSQLARLTPNLKKRGQHLLQLVENQFLHAKELSFIHPTTGKVVTFNSDLPPKLKSVLHKLPDLFLL